LQKEIYLAPETLALLFAADRNEHLYADEGILSHVNTGYFVASDRYALSSLVYQGIECGDELPLLLNSRFPVPEITIYLDIDPQIALERLKGRPNLEIFEYIEFQEKVYEKYKALIEFYRENGARIEIIDASKSIQEIADQVWSIVSAMPIFNT
jgi:dTMP kinase